MKRVEGKTVFLIGPRRIVIKLKERYRGLKQSSDGAHFYFFYFII